MLLKKAADRAAGSPLPLLTRPSAAAQSFWLEDCALFMAVKAEQGQCVRPAPAPAGRPALPRPEVIAAAEVRLADQIGYHRGGCSSSTHYTQWNALKAYANRKGVLLQWAIFPHLRSARIPVSQVLEALKLSPLLTLAIRN
ncbi:MAG: 4-alpha-glucanotransferase, partial [Faecalibacterium prausnitzii]